MIRFALPKALADEIRELQRGLGEREPKPGKFFRDRAADLIQRERQRQADREGLADLARTAADVRELRERFDRFLGIFQAYSKTQVENTATTLKAISDQLDALQQQIGEASFLMALGDGKDGK
jgi:hypothetical protein